MLQQSSAPPATPAPLATAPAVPRARVGSDVDQQRSSAEAAVISPLPAASGAASTSPPPEGPEVGGVGAGSGLRVGVSEDGGAKQQQMSKEELLQEVCQRWCTLWWPGLFLKVSRSQGGILKGRGGSRVG